MKYDDNMDKECIELCDTLNAIKGVRTFASCCGHLKYPYEISFYVDNFYAMSILARAFDLSYSNGMWDILLESADCSHRKTGATVFRLRRTEPFTTQEEMETELKQAIESIKYWQQKKFKAHLSGKERKR